MDKKTLNPITAQELLQEEIPPRIEIIPHLLYTGCYLLAGPPKIGKSYMAMQIAHHVSMGQDLWDMHIGQHNVLYCALEDDHERLQRRYGLMSDFCLNEHLYFSINAPKLSDGLAEEISNFCINKNCKLVIIDTLQMIRTTQNYQNPYGDDCTVISSLRDIAIKVQACVLFLHHTRKMDAADVFELVSGTNGIFGSVDGGMVLLKKDRIDNEAVLRCTGRDISDVTLKLSFDRSTCMWQCISIDRQPWVQPPDPFIEAVNNLVRDCKGHWEGTPTKLSEVLNNGQWHINKVTGKLNAFVKDLLEIYNIKYTYKRSRDKMIYLDYISNDLSGCVDNANE